MSDQVQTAKPAWSISNTLAASGSVGSLGIVAGYLSDCSAAHHMLPLTRDLVIIMLCLVAPPAHLIIKVLNAKLTKWAAAQGVQP